jgi:hypothetical protein
MKYICLIGFVSGLLFSCGNGESSKMVKKLNSEALAVKSKVVKGDVKIVEPVLDEDEVVLEKDGITLTEIKTSHKGEASIKLDTKNFGVGKNQLSFSVEGIPDYSISYLANNYSLTQFKSSIFEVEFLNGNNVFLSFLTYKNNISVKTNEGSLLKSAVLGGVESLFDMDQPHLFYYLPMAETEAPILDFYLVNSTISEKGNKVKVTINETEFIINKWTAYKISGLQDSQNSVRIQLLDKNNQLIEGPFNDSGERRFRVL